MLQLGKKRLPLTEPKIYLSISSEGYGHSSRAIAIARAFTHDEVLIGTYSYALDRVREFKLNTVPISQEYKLMGSEGSFDVGKTILKNQSSLLMLNQMVAEEKDIMLSRRVTLVVADGRIAPVIAASQLGLPCLVLTNQSDFYPFFQHDSALVKLFGKSFEWWMRSWLSSADEILIPDYYPPDTVCLMNLSPSLHVKKRTRFLGPLVAWTRDEIPDLPKPEGYDHYVVVSLGGHAYRQPLLEAVLQIAPQFPAVQFDLLTSLHVDAVPANVSRRGHVHDCAALFKAADCVITQAGHSTAMELMTLGTPAIVVPDMAQSEQQNNALRLAQLNVAIHLDYERIHESPAVLAKALNTMLTNSKYKRHAEQMALKSANMNGAQFAARILSDYAHRLLAY